MPKVDGIPVIGLLGTILSTIFLSGVNIILSGHILGSAFNLKTTGSNFFTLNIPNFLYLEVKGDRAIAGFAAFAVSLIFVGIVLSDLAELLFIKNMRATDDKWTAVQSLAASLSVICCLIIGAFKSMVNSFLSWRKSRETEETQLTPNERVSSLIGRADD